MFGIKNALDNLEVAINDLESCVKTTSVENFYDDDLVKRISLLTNREVSLRDRIMNEYGKNSDKWAGEGYKSASQALSYVTHNSSSAMKNVLNRVEFMEEFPFVEEVICAGEVCLDHVDVLIKYYKDDFYKEDLTSNIELLIENAKVLPAQRFALAMKHWKYMIQEFRDHSSIDIKNYNARKFSMWQDSIGNWVVEGVLDPISGELLHKALESIRNKIWNSCSKEQREQYDFEQANADALGYLAKGFIAHDFDAIPVKVANENEDIEIEQSFSFKPVLTADIVIDIENLTSNKPVEEFLQESLNKGTPLGRAHSHKLVKQILCDATASFPLKTEQGFENLGRKVRIAPTRMKKQLALQNDQCEVHGCSVPARWCDAHHIRHWLHGGETKIENLVLLCGRHHTMVHHDKHFEEKLSTMVSEKRKIKTKVNTENIIYKKIPIFIPNQNAEKYDPVDIR